jgi:transposase-like protein
MAAIAEHFGVHYSTVSRWAKNYEEAESLRGYGIAGSRLPAAEIHAASRSPAAACCEVAVRGNFRISAAPAASPA